MTNQYHRSEIFPKKENSKIFERLTLTWNSTQIGKVFMVGRVFLQRRNVGNAIRFYGKSRENSRIHKNMRKMKSFSDLSLGNGSG